MPFHATTNLTVGDLVWCPALAGVPRQRAYTGIVIGVYGHKATILGGPQVKETWDICDIHLVSSVGEQ